MLSQAMTKQLGQQRKARQERAESKIWEFLRNPPRCSSSSTTEDPRNFADDLKKVFEMMHVVDTKRVELSAYQLKNVARTWFDKWKEAIDEDISRTSWVY